MISFRIYIPIWSVQNRLVLSEFLNFIITAVTQHFLLLFDDYFINMQSGSASLF